MEGYRLDISGRTSNADWLRDHGASYGQAAPNMGKVNGAIYAVDPETDTLSTLFKVEGMTESVPNPHFEENRRMGDQLAVQIDRTRRQLSVLDNTGKATLAAGDLIQQMQGRISVVLPNLRAMSTASAYNTTLPDRAVFCAFWKPRLIAALDGAFARKQANEIDVLLAMPHGPEQPYTVVDFEQWKSLLRARWVSMLENYKCETFPYTDQLIQFFLAKLVEDLWQVQLLSKQIRTQITTTTQQQELDMKKDVVQREMLLITCVPDPRLYVWLCSILGMFPYGPENVGGDDPILRAGMNRDLLREISRAVSPQNSLHIFHHRIVEPLLGNLSVLFSNVPRAEVADISPPTNGFESNAGLAHVLNSRLQEIRASDPKYAGYATQIKDVVEAMYTLLKGSEFANLVDAAALFLDSTYAELVPTASAEATTGRQALYQPLQNFVKYVQDNGHREWGSVHNGLYMGTEQDYVSHKTMDITGLRVDFAEPVRYVDQTTVEDRLVDIVNLSFSSTFPNRRNAINENMARVTHDLYAAERWMMQWEEQVDMALRAILGVGSPDAERNMNIMRLRMDLRELDMRASMLRPRIDVPRTLCVQFFPDAASSSEMVAFHVHVKDERTTQNTGNVYTFTPGKGRLYTFVWKARQSTKANVTNTMGSIPALSLGVPLQRDMVLKSEADVSSRDSALSLHVGTMGPGEVWCEVSNTDEGAPPKTLVMESARSTLSVKSQCARTGKWYDPFCINNSTNTFGSAAWTAPNGIAYRGHLNAFTAHPVPYCALVGVRGDAPTDGINNIDFDAAHTMIVKTRNKLFGSIGRSAAVKSAMLKALVKSNPRWNWLQAQDIGSNAMEVENWFVFSFVTEKVDDDVGMLRRLFTNPRAEQAYFSLAEEEVNAINMEVKMDAVRMFTLEDLYNSWQVLPTNGPNAAKVDVYDPFFGWSKRSITQMSMSPTEVIELLAGNLRESGSQRTTFQGRFTLQEQYRQTQPFDGLFSRSVQTKWSCGSDDADSLSMPTPGPIPSVAEMGAFLVQRVGVTFAAQYV